MPEGLVKPRKVTKETNILVFNDFDGSFCRPLTEAGYWAIECYTDIYGNKSEVPVSSHCRPEPMEELLSYHFIDMVILFIADAYNTNHTVIPDKFKQIYSLLSKPKIAIFSEVSLKEVLPFFSKEDQYIKGCKFGSKEHKVDMYAYYSGLPVLKETTPKLKRSRYFDTRRSNRALRSLYSTLSSACIDTWGPNLP